MSNNHSAHDLMPPLPSDAPTPKPPVKPRWRMFVIEIASVLGSFYHYVRFPDLSGIDLARSHAACFLLAAIAFVLSIIVSFRLVLRRISRDEPLSRIEKVQLACSVAIFFAALFLFSKSYCIFFG